MKSEKDVVYFSYPSLTELVDRAHDETDFPLNQRSSRQGTPGGPVTGNSSNWYGATWEEASTMSRNGDIEGARKLRVKTLNVVNALLKDKPRLDPIYRLDEGHWIDTARYVKGEPEAWGAMVESEVMLPRKGIALVVNASYNSGVKPSDIEAIAVQIGGTILALQSMGYAITMYVAESIMGREHNYVVSAPVNPNGGPLDMSRISAILKPWFLRRILFSLEETYAENTRRDIGVGHGYGHPLAISLTAVTKFATPGFTPVIVNIAEWTHGGASRVQQFMLDEIKKGGTK